MILIKWVAEVHLEMHSSASEPAGQCPKAYIDGREFILFRTARILRA